MMFLFFPISLELSTKTKTNLIERSPFFIFIGFSRFTKAEVKSISDLFVYRAVLRYTKSLSEVNNISHST